MSNCRIASTFPQLPILIAPLVIVFKVWCSELDRVLQRSPDLREDSGPRSGLNLGMEFLLDAKFLTRMFSLCNWTAETQVLSAGASPQPCLCLLRSDSNCYWQRWLFMGTPFLCLTEGQCSSSERESDASMWVTLNLLLFFSSFRLLLCCCSSALTFPPAQLTMSPCLIYWSYMLDLSVLLCIPQVHSIEFHRHWIFPGSFLPLFHVSLFYQKDVAGN